MEFWMSKNNFNVFERESLRKDILLLYFDQLYYTQLSRRDDLSSIALEDDLPIYFVKDYFSVTFYVNDIYDSHNLNNEVDSEYFDLIFLLEGSLVFIFLFGLEEISELSRNFEKIMDYDRLEEWVFILKNLPIDQKLVSAVMTITVLHLESKNKYIPEVLSSPVDKENDLGFYREYIYDKIILKFFKTMASNEWPENNTKYFEESWKRWSP